MCLQLQSNTNDIVAAAAVCASVIPAREMNKLMENFYLTDFSNWKTQPHFPFKALELQVPLHRIHLHVCLVHRHCSAAIHFHSTCVAVTEVQCILFVSQNLNERNNVGMNELAENFYLTDCSDWKTFFLVFHSNLLQSYKVTCINISTYLCIFNSIQINRFNTSLWQHRSHTVHNKQQSQLPQR